MAVPYHGLLNLYDESDSDSAEDWFIRPRPASAVPGASKHGRRRVGGGMRQRSNNSWDLLHTQHPIAQRRQPIGQVDHPISARRSFESQIPGQYLDPPPRNPARFLTVPTTEHAPKPSRSQSETREKQHHHHHHLHRHRRTSNVDGTTVSRLAANVIHTTNHVFGAMVQHAHSNTDTDSTHDSNGINGDSAYHTQHHSSILHHRRVRRPSSTYSSTSDSLAVMRPSHRR